MFQFFTLLSSIRVSPGPDPTISPLQYRDLGANDILTVFIFLGVIITALVCILSVTSKRRHP